MPISIKDMQPFDNHLTPGAGPEGNVPPPGLGAGVRMRDRFWVYPHPTRVSRRGRRKKGRPLSASPPVGPTDISEPTHTPFRLFPTNL